MFSKSDIIMPTIIQKKIYKICMDLEYDNLGTYRKKTQQK